MTAHRPSSGRSFPAWVRESLRRSGLSQAELARQLTIRLQRSIDRAALNKLTTGKRGLLAEEMLAIAAITGSMLPPVPGGGHVSLNRSNDESSEFDLVLFRNHVAGALAHFLGYSPETAEELVAALLEFSRKAQSTSARPHDPDRARTEGATLARLFSIGLPGSKDHDQKP